MTINGLWSTAHRRPAINQLLGSRRNLRSYFAALGGSSFFVGRVRTQPLPCKLTVGVRGNEMTIDLSELRREVNAPMNSGRSGGGSTVIGDKAHMSVRAGPQDLSTRD